MTKTEKLRESLDHPLSYHHNAQMTLRLYGIGLGGGR